MFPKCVLISVFGDFPPVHLILIEMVRSPLRQPYCHITSSGTSGSDDFHPVPSGYINFILIGNAKFLFKVCTRITCKSPFWTRALFLWVLALIRRPDIEDGRPLDLIGKKREIYKNNINTMHRPINCFHPTLYSKEAQKLRRRNNSSSMQA